MDQAIAYAKHLNADSYTIDWLTANANKLTDLTEAEHLVDYLVSPQKPKRVSRMSLAVALAKANTWTKALAKKGKHITETEDDTEVVLDFKDGFKFVQLKGKASYEREGYLMRHCVASYYGKDVKVYSLRDSSNEPHCTIEQDKQIKGKGNGSIHPRYIDYVVRFLEHTGMQVRDSEMLHLGYRLAQFPEYMTKASAKKLYRGKYIYESELEEYQDNVIIFEDKKNQDGNTQTIELAKACSYKGKKIVLYKGNANFNSSNITSLGKLKSIGGYADFNYSNITSLGELKSIGGSANFNSSNITSLGALTSIGGYAYFSSSKITSLGKLKSIGGYADFSSSKVTSLGELQSIDGGANLSSSNITSLGKLQSIGGNANFNYSNITSLGELKSIGGYANFNNSNITDWKNVKIKGRIYEKL